MAGPAEVSMQRTLLLAFALLLGAPAQALVYVSGTGQGNTSPPPDDPGWNHMARVSGLNGIYIGNGWVITADHVPTGNPVIQGVWYAVVPGSAVTLENPDESLADLKVFRVDPHPPLPLMPIRATTPLADTDVTMIAGGVLRGTATSWMGYDGWFWGGTSGMHWGTNEVYETGLEGNNWVISTDFTKPSLGGTTHEAQGATGDSGGALFIKNGGTWELAGVLFAIGPFAGQPDSTALQGKISQPVGNLTYSTDLSVYRDQIIDLTRPECANEIDDDGDTFVDWPDDPDCASELGLSELPDQDEDGVGDVEDNCLILANPDQLDTNQDGYGNLCDADFNDDEAVGSNDFNAFKQAFQTVLGGPGYDADIDLNGDGAIGGPDFTLFRDMFQGPPGPSGLSCAGNPPCP
jgi:hypothetical protein